MFDRRFVLGGLLAAGTLAIGACGGDDRSTEAFCKRVDEAQAVGDRVQRLDPSDLEGTQKAFRDASEEIGRISEVAPEDIRNDVEQLDQAFNRIADAASDANSTRELQQQLVGAQDQFAGVAQASQRVTRFQERNCENGGGGAGGQGGSGGQGQNGGEGGGG